MNLVVVFLTLLGIHFSYQQFIPDTDCFREFNKGNTYNGTVSIREDGVPCITWKDNILNYAGYRVDHNFCRNPSPNNAYKPWCYSSVKGNNWGYCNIPYCDTDCLQEINKGETYNGTVSTTENGTPCVKWKDAGYREDHKFCRNPTKSDKPWCYTSVWNNWGYCNILSCGIPCPEFPHIDNTVKLNKTVGYLHPDIVNITCQTGYEMRGSSEVQCNVGKWSELPKCLGQLCPEFPSIDNTKKVNKTDGYRHPDTVTVTCQTGYEIIRASLVQCNAGRWSELPMCLGPRCPQFPNISNTMQLNKTDGYRHPDTVTVKCQTGFEMVGSASVHCVAETWSALPTCLHTPSSLMAGHVAGGVVGVAVFVLVIVGGIIFLKRRRYTHTRKQQYVKREQQSNASCITLDPTVSLYAQVNKQGKNNVYLNINGTDNGGYYDFSSGPQIPKNAIKIQDYYDYVEKEREGKGKIETEFSKLKSGLQKPTTVALKAGNKLKNKYKDMYAYDESRVVLEELDRSNNSDYINASFVSGPNHIRKYIASQGPIDKTVNDFWRMVWQYDCCKIVMLTNVVEEGKQKCVQYWPVSEKENVNFGVIKIVLMHESVYADFTVRSLKMLKDNEMKTVQQYHFTAWPDKDVPKYASSIVYFRHKVNSSKVTSGPIIVHCSAGVGRTGTFIALDYVVDQAKELGYVDVFACVDGLRNQRVNMVQTQRQYVFLHDAILEALMCPNSGIPAKDFPETYKELLQFDNKKKKHNLQIEYEIMNQISPRHDKGLFEIGKSWENKRKNRYSNILPVGSEMPLLSTVVDGHNEYINAVFLPGYRNSKAFIISQMPLESTSTDLWRLVYDYKISTIIMLNQYNRTEEIYWPETAVPVSYGPFCIEKASSESAKGYKCLTLMINYRKVQRRVKLFQSTFWDDDDIVPKSANDVFMFMKEIENCHDSSVDGPILVHCLNGCDKSGLYCVLATVIERLRIEQDVDIQYTIKQMRNRRPQIIPNYEQFQFLYEAVLEYQKQFETYSNFQ